MNQEEHSTTSIHGRRQLITAVMSLIFTAAFIGLLVILTRGFQAQKLSCQSSSGDIIIEFNGQTIAGYTASETLEFDFQGQKEYAERVGLEPYLAEFQEWFTEHTDGACHR